MRRGPCTGHSRVAHHTVVRNGALVAGWGWAAASVLSSPPLSLPGRSHRSHRSHRPRGPGAVSPSVSSDELQLDSVPTSSTSHWQDHLRGKSLGERTALQSYMGSLTAINRLEPGLVDLSDEDLKEKTSGLRERLRRGAKREDVLVEAFAVVREASKRVLGMRHYDVQILGGIALSAGQITEMRTGEGKTLVAILPAYLYGLEGKGAHVVTVNDYLAQRDAEWVGKVLEFLGMRVGVVTSKTSQQERHVELAADVTYLTAYELAFMYLQDNSAPPSFPIALSRPLHYAVVDEVDSILIDEARNPFIVNMPGAEDAGLEASWMVAVRVAMELEGPAGVDGMSPEELVRYFDGVPMDEFMTSADFIPEPRIKGATLTRRGMAQAVEILAREGHVYLAVQDDSERGGEQGQPAWYSVVVEAGTRVATVRQLKTVDNWFGMDDGDEDSSVLERIVLSEMSDVCSILKDRGLRSVGADEIPPQHNVWHLAVPAVLWSSSNAWGRFINQAVRAVHAFHKDVDYIVRGGEIVVIDTATGRERERSRWQSGLHQAIEAKEMVLRSDEELKIRPEDFDQGKITYQVLFSEYATLSGMTGTAATEAEEFEEAYGLSVVRIPPHRPSLRVDYRPEVYGGKPAWANAILKVVCGAIEHDRPVLVGTMSVEASEEVHKILSNTPMGDVTLSDVDRLALAGALVRAPRDLPEPPSGLSTGDAVDGDDGGAGENLKNALAFYKALMVDYDSVMEYLRWVANGSTADAPAVHDPEDVRFAITVMRNAISARAWSFRNPTELEAVKECYEVLLEALGSATLSKSRVINLLNARPERSRKEAEIIAQAGLPGTITVATSMAGRGTDILLGGNPKGLVLSTLKYLFEDRLFDRARRGYDRDPVEVPLARVHPAFVDHEASMRAHLPEVLFSAYVESATEVAGLDADTDLVDLSENFLDMVVEKAELMRNHLRMKAKSSARLSSHPSTEMKLYAAAFDEEDWAAYADSTSMVSQLEAEVPHETFGGLLKYALLQWAWFDAQCDAMGNHVRQAGGLCVVIASVPESRRAELQLRGRAGRQGDPGQTHIIASLEDPVLGSALLPNQQKDIWRYIEESGSSNEPLPSLVIDPIIKSVTRNLEQLQQGGRDVSRKYDAVIDSYRRHVYRMRRILTRGSEVARAGLFHDNLRDLAEDLVDFHCPSSRVRAWNLRELVRDAVNLLEDVGHDDGDEEATVIPLAQHASMSMHLIDADYIVALIDDPEDIVDVGGVGGNGSPETSTGASGLPLDERLRSSLSSLRFSLAPSVDALPTVDFRRTATPIPIGRTNAMRHTRQRRKDRPMALPTLASDPKKAILAAWLGDMLCSMYETKRSITIDALVCSQLTAQPMNAFQAAAVIRVWERDAALDCIDALWSDFLQDVAVLQQASQGRAFSMFDPVDEFRLESAKAFSSLLRRYSAIVSSRLLGCVDIQHVRYLESASGVSPASSQEDVNIEFVLELANQ